MKLISLKRKPKRSLRRKLSEAPIMGADESEYPWGLELNLENESIEKIGIDVENTNVGDDVYFTARAKINSVSESESVHSGKGK